MTKQRRSWVVNEYFKPLQKKVFKNQIYTPSITHYEERMPRWLENPIFCHRVLNFILLDDDFFLENFNCIKVIRRLLTTENHFSKSTLSQNFEELEIFKGLKRRQLLFDEMVQKLHLYDNKTSTWAWLLWGFAFLMSFSITSPLLLTNLTWPSLVLMVIISVLTLYFCFCLSLCLNLSRKLPLSKSLARLLNAMMMSMIVLSRVSDHMFWCDTVLTGPSAQLSVNSNRAGFTSDWHKNMVRV